MKVAFIDSVHPALENELKNNGYQCADFFHPSKEEMKTIIHDYDGIVIRSRFRMDEDFLQHAINLKFIARSGAGMENIDLEYCKKRNITCFNSPEGNADAVGEHAVAMLLSLFNNIIRADAEVRKGIWEREGNRGYELEGKTVGIIGFGNMGSALAKKLRGFDCKILAYDKYKENFAPDYVKEVSLEELQNESDIVSLHLPINAETNYFFNADFISKMRKPFFLINTARGKNVNTKDLVDGMKTEIIKGACLDVLEYELASFEKLDITQLPEPFQYLVKSDRVVLSPHIAGWTVESYRKLSSYLAEKIIAKFGKF
jgi:D-3-phosphoglycerate dehydrogenase